MGLNGLLTDVRWEWTGTEISADLLTGETVLPVVDPESITSGEFVWIVGTGPYEILETDVDAATFTVTPGLSLDVDSGAEVARDIGGSPGRAWVAEVILPDAERPVEVPLTIHDLAVMPEGTYDPPVAIVISDDMEEVEDLPGSLPSVDGEYLDPQVLADIDNAITFAQSKNRVFPSSATPPTSTPEYTLQAGDVWFDENNTLHTWSGTDWVSAQDAQIAATAQAAADAQTDATQAINDALAAQQTADDAIATFQNEYAVSTSETVAPTTGWSTATPVRNPGEFIWFRTTVVNGVGTSETTSPALLTGNDGAPGSQGVPGPAGADGQSLFTWVKYADTPTTGMSDSPTGKTYMGLAYNKTTSTESTTYGDYSWSLIKGADGADGADGVPGPPGADGQPTYTWVKYADSAAGAGMSDSPTGKTYLGLAYNKTTATESTTASDYSWSLIQGPQGPAGPTGPQGPQGIQGSAGTDGTDGASLYTWLKYADTPTTGMSDSPTGKTYMGIAYNKTSATESTTYSDYDWSLIQGPQGPQGNQGIAGPAGADGQPTYTWVKYATNATGTTGFSDSPSGATYIGFAFNKTTATESTTPSDYQWSLIQGPQGPQGPQGIQGSAGTNGTDGASLYTWLKYADSPTTGMSDSPTGKTYMGVAYNKTSATESTTYSDYSWSLIQGPQGPQGPQGNTGIQGPAGADGQPTYTWVKYAPNGAPSAAQMSDTPGTNTYIGFAFNKTTATESTVPTDYQWSLIQGPQGPQGPTGPTGSTGSTGPQGTSITSVTPYWATVATGAAAPAQPGNVATPSAPWTTTEPPFTASTDLYQTNRIAYSNGTYSYTTVTKVTSYQQLQAWAYTGTTKIDGGDLQNDTVTTGALVADAITSKFTITGATYQTVATASRGVKINSAGLTAYADGSVSGIPAGTATLTINGTTGSIGMIGDLNSGSNIQGATITGTLQTTTAANRGVKITNAGMTFYDNVGTALMTLASGTTGRAAFAITGVITGTDISGSTVTGGTVQTETTASRGIKLNSSGLTAYDGSGNPTFTITASTGAVSMKGDLTSGSTIAGATVTGGTLQTGTSGVRVVIRNDATGGLAEFYTGDAAETAPGFLRGGTWAGLSVRLSSPTTTTYPYPGSFDLLPGATSGDGQLSLNVRTITANVGCTAVFSYVQIGSGGALQTDTITRRPSSPNAAISVNDPIDMTSHSINNAYNVQVGNKVLTDTIAPNTTNFILFQPTNGIIKFSGGSNIGARVGQDPGTPGNGTAVTFTNSWVAATTDNMNAGAPTSANTMPFYAKTINGFGAYVNASDEREKNSITPVSGDKALAVVKKLKVKSYRMNEVDPERVQYGLISQDVEKVLPSAVMDMGETKGLSYQDLWALNLRATQALIDRIEELEARLN